METSLQQNDSFCRRVNVSNGGVTLQGDYSGTTLDITEVNNIVLLVCQVTRHTTYRISTRSFIVILKLSG
jgi:hypothetical protein